MLFPYLYKLRMDDIFVVFHPLTFDVVFFSGYPGNEKMDDADIEEAVRQTDLAAHWCVEDDFSYEAYIDAFLASSSYGRVDIKLFREFEVLKMEEIRSGECAHYHMLVRKFFLTEKL